MNQNRTTITITDSTTREDLIALVTKLDMTIDDLEDTVIRLENRIADMVEELERPRPTPEQEERLAEAAELLAESGRIHNTPFSKAAYVAGEPGYLWPVQGK